MAARIDRLPIPLALATPGRDEAVAALAEQVASRGFAIAFDLLRDSAEAEDAVQEALARAWTRYGQLRDPDALPAWFHRVLVNHCMRTLRRRRLIGLFRRRDDGD